MYELDNIETQDEKLWNYILWQTILIVISSIIC